MKKHFGFISFALIVLVIVFFMVTVTSVIRLDVTMFRIFMILGVLFSLLFSLLSEKGNWKRVSLVLSILVGLFYFLGIEVMRLVFQGNGF